FNIYPNPTTTDREINLSTTCKKVEVFNALGVKVAEYQNVDTLDAFETAGIYVIRVTNNGNVKHCRLVVK
ncbi:MAG: T9SS type A sorting domain-containing protein, partial [Bacteroidales bacterium]|nr:T9SS type A sorting domain-containing protein [Bacteroidales bacterium]